MKHPVVREGLAQQAATQPSKNLTRHIRLQLHPVIPMLS